VLCPKCKTERAHRSHRKGLKDYVSSFFGYHPYRCHECGNRFLQAHWAESGPPEKPNSTEKEIRTTRARQAREQKRREFLLYGAGLLVFLIFLYYVTRDRDTRAESSGG